MTQQPYVPIAEVTRGPRVESSHRGAVAVVDSFGRLTASVGNVAQGAFVRSCAKPFQALALVCSGAADAFELRDEEIAIACASHSGEPDQIEAVRRLLDKTGLDPGYLRCGIHPPFDQPTRHALVRAGEQPTVLHNNCSGKHAGMLVLARHLGLSLDDYADPHHGVQMAILGLLAYLSGLELHEISLGVDGCGVPAFYLPLRSFSLALARFAALGEGLTDDVAANEDGGPSEDEAYEDWDEDIEPYEDDVSGTGPGDPEDEDIEHGDDFSDSLPVSPADGMRRIWTAMKDHPELVSGRRGRLCYDLMRTAASFDVPLVAKSGGEGTYAVAALAEGRGVGITVKVEDGAQRARDAAVIETLLQLGILPDEARGPLAGYHHQAILNHAREPVGEVRPVFRLHRGLPA